MTSSETLWSNGVASISNSRQNSATIPVCRSNKNFRQVVPSMARRNRFRSSDCISSHYKMGLLLCSYWYHSRASSSKQLAAASTFLVVVNRFKAKNHSTLRIHPSRLSSLKGGSSSFQSRISKQLPDGFAECTFGLEGISLARPEEHLSPFHGHHQRCRSPTPLGCQFTGKLFLEFEQLIKLQRLILDPPFQNR